MTLKERNVPQLKTLLAWLKKHPKPNNMIAREVEALEWAIKELEGDDAR